MQAPQDARTIAVEPKKVDQSPKKAANPSLKVRLLALEILDRMNAAD